MTGGAEGSPERLVSVIVPVRNASAPLRRCLASVSQAAGKRPVEVIVADNGSTDGSTEVAALAGARVLSLPGLRVSQVRSRAVQEARGEIVAFIDADHEIARGWFDAAVTTLQQPGVGAVGAPYLPPSPATWVQRLYDALRRRPEGLHDAEWVASGNMAVWRSVFEEVGGFDGRLESCEDVDLCRRIRARGYRVLSNSRLESVHHGDPATLGDLFRGELWRGRDTLRIGFARPIDVRKLPSALLPVVTLTAASGIVLLLPAVPLLGYWPLAAAAALLAILPLPRATIMVRRGSARRRLAELPRAYAVAAVYEVARALALVARAGHEVRRGES